MKREVLELLGTEELESACLRAVASAARRFDPEKAMVRDGKPPVPGCPQGFLSAVIVSIKNELNKLLMDYVKHHTNRIHSDSPDDDRDDLLSTAPDPSDRPPMDTEEARELIDSLFRKARLTKQERQVLVRMANGETAAVIGERYGLTRKGIHDIANTARAKIRAVSPDGV